ncbi:energy transducer TonB [Hymenobacter convexus]|uniref:energy transducer TonB n=1 Tax=Hymenobacter sp. CA1UV-4 TaxID=3063782 RepID=UPI002712E4DF|nr:energy transducer TonB [Hymenobacter sp. CA1UV-4]MDO7852648.1 energy transducer TonB [Hymenobacter sp. CA1UV-4]
MYFLLFRHAVVALVAAPLAAVAQNAPSADTIYYNAAAECLPTRAGAVRSIVTTPTAAGGMVQHVFNRSGRRLEQIPYSDKAGKMREGMALSWYPGGELKGRRVYRAGQLEGQLQAYYPDGTLRQLELYEKGDSKTRLCFDAAGKVTSCPTTADGALVYARYRRGPLMLGEEVSHTVRFVPLPPGSRGERVIVACMVGVDGQIHETRIYKSVGPEHDREALRVVENLRATWTPELKDNEPVESFYMVNVDFLPRH